MKLIEKLSEELDNFLRSEEFNFGDLHLNNVYIDTENWYQKIYDTMYSRLDHENGLGLIEVISKTESKNTYYSRIAACRYIIRKNILLEFSKINDSTKISDIDSIYSSKHRLQHLIATLNQVMLLRGKCQLIQKKQRQSKRKSLTGLPTDWREKLFLRMINSKYDTALLITAITGCRPIELKNGVNLTINTNASFQYLAIKIKGAKVTEQNGHPERELIFKIDKPSFLLNLLIFKTQQNNGNLLVKIENTKAFTAAITRFGKITWPNHKFDITPYSFRHAFASDMKFTSNAEDVAKSLGHASLRTQKSYGQKQQSRSANQSTPTEILVQRKIRSTSKAHAYKEDTFLSKSNPNFLLE